MRPLSAKPRTKAQKEATKKMLLSSPRGRAISWCKQAVKNGLVVIDTETTDLDGYVIQIAAVCCKTGDVLYESLVATEHQISSNAINIHGITPSRLENAPCSDYVADHLINMLSGKEWTAFNIDFDECAIKRTFGDSLIKTMSDKCAMRVAATVFGSTNRYGSISLNDAMQYAKVERSGNAHDAASDAIATVDVIRAIAKLL
jgi:DNA polymerase III epsilon subunit-like protein